MFKKSFFLLLLVKANLVFSIPYQSPKCNSVKGDLKHPKNAQGLVFDEDCTTAYVLPPDFGSVRIEAIAKSSNLNLCPTVNKIPSMNHRFIEMIDKILTRIENLMESFDPQKKELEELREKTDKARAGLARREEKFHRISREYETLLEEKKSSSRDLKHCKSDENSACAEEQRTFDNAKEDFKTFYTSQYLPSHEAYEDAKFELKSLNAEYSYRSNEFSESLQPLLTLQSQARELSVELFNLYKDYAPIQGLTGQAVYNVPWSDVLNSYNEINSSSGLSFVKVPILSSQIYASAKVDGKDAYLPVLLHANIPGVKDFSSEFKDLGSESLGNEVGLGLGDATFSGQIALSLIGACPYFPEGVSSKRDAIKESDLTAHIVANAVYSYPMKARRSYTAKYNMSKFMKRVEKRSKRSGWFSSKDTHSVVEDGDSSDWFDIQFDSVDPDFQYTAEEQSAITKEVKLDLIERALKAVASITFNGSAPPLPELPKTEGAFVRTPHSLCWGWAYCYGASYFVGVLSSFGSRSSVSEFTRNHNVWVRDHVDQASVLRRTATLSFSSKAKE